MGNGENSLLCTENNLGNCSIKKENLEYKTQMEKSNAIIHDLLLLIDNESTHANDVDLKIREALGNGEDTRSTTDIVKNLVTIIMDQKKDQKKFQEQLHSKVEILQDENEKLQKDNLTGLYNMHKFSSTFKEFKESGETYSLGIIDIDFFKKINDSYGHDIGNITLQYLSNRLRENFDEKELFRFGGEEFIIFGKYRPSELKEKLDFLLENFKNKKLSYNKDKKISFHLTFSGGITTCYSTNEYEAIFSKADETLYKAKNEGRQRIYLSD